MRLNHCVVSSSFPKFPSVTLWQTEIVSLACDYTQKYCSISYCAWVLSPLEFKLLEAGFKVRPISLLWHCLSRLSSLARVCLCSVCEYCSTGDLYTYWSLKGCFDERDVRVFSAELGSALGECCYMHCLLTYNTLHAYFAFKQSNVFSLESFSQTGVVNLYQWHMLF